MIGIMYDDKQDFIKFNKVLLFLWNKMGEKMEKKQNFFIKLQRRNQGLRGMEKQEFFIKEQ